MKIDRSDHAVADALPVAGTAEVRLSPPTGRVPGIRKFSGVGQC